MIRSALDLSRAAHVGGICLCVPSFTTSRDVDGEVSEGFLDHMEDTHGVGSFDAGSEETRFEALLEGDSPLGAHLRTHFRTMRCEVHGATSFADMPSDSPFKLGPEGAGVIRGKVVRRVQHAFTEARENARVSVIMDGLRSKLNRRGIMPSRDEVAFLSINRLSVQFVGLPKMRRTIINNITFKEKK